MMVGARKRRPRSGLWGKTGVYAIECVENGKAYVGQATNIGKRINHHRWSLDAGRHANPHLQSAWDKYGEESFTIRILEETSDLDAAEERWMDSLDAINSGFNQRKGCQPLRGESAPRATLTEAQVKEARRRCLAGETGVDVAREFGVTSAAVCGAVSGRTWGHIKNPPPVENARERRTRSSRRKLTEESVATLRRDFKAGKFRVGTRAKEMGISPKSLRAAISGATWRSVAEPPADPKHFAGIAKGAGHHAVALTANMVVEIRQRAKSGERLVDICKCYPASKATIYEAAKGKTWKYLDEVEAPYGV
jgi:hypothetical protein